MSIYPNVAKRDRINLTRLAEQKKERADKVKKIILTKLMIKN